MADIFLSYVREDLARAKVLVPILESYGWSVWWDRTLTAGEPWSETIERELTAARCVLVLWSMRSVRSEYVRDEAQDGLDRGVLVPALIDDATRPPLGFRQRQSANLVGWNGDRSHPEFDVLVGGIRNAASSSSRTPDGIVTVVEALGPLPDGTAQVPPASAPASPALPTPKPKRAAKTSPKTRAPRPTKTVAPQRDAASSEPRTEELEVGAVELVSIPAGSFQMGSPESEEGRYDDEGPQRLVTVLAFAVGRYAVTNEEYGRYLTAHPRAKKPKFWGQSAYNQPRQPVVGVSWEDARRFAAWVGGRLPTEAEWEYAARAGTTAPHLVGSTDQDLDRVAWYDGNSGFKLHPVGQKEPNAWGLHDVLGNVWEWVEDDYHGDYNGAPDDGSAWIDEPRGAVRRVLRGGSWSLNRRVARASSRFHDAPTDRDFDVGFRVVRVSPIP